ncbi:hypothetical protein GCM10011594_40770 [Nakamurella endophytica]|uniref:Uncharacterized protein n=1 Tax=Nakamurella endophytica TaxID=1748367 RepID=A0A917TBR3_9ACTN|nr:hypothetical protein GCM10011594_40770 [Nakamurella endophytica]
MTMPEPRRISAARGTWYPGPTGISAGSRPPLEASTTYDAAGQQQPGEAGGLRGVPGTLDPVRGRQPDEQRLAGRPGAADGVDDLEQQPGAAVEVAAVPVGAVVAQRGQELVQQVPVRGVQLDHVEAGEVGAARGVDESGLERGEVVGGHLARGGVAGERVGGRADGRPAALVGGDGAGGLAREATVGGGLAAGVRELDTDGGTLAVDEVDDARPRRRLLLVPQAGVLRADPALRGHRSGFGEDEPEAALRAGSQVHQVPVGRHAVLLGDRVLAHRRQPDPVGHAEVAQGDGGEEMSHARQNRCRRPAVPPPGVG